MRVFSGHRGSILSLAFSPDGKYLASAGEDRRVKIWDLASSNLFKDFRGHNETIHSLTWSSDSNLLGMYGSKSLERRSHKNKERKKFLGGGILLGVREGATIFSIPQFATTQLIF